jgi:UPF0271 protein
MPKFVDINCDMGESYGRWTLGNDAEVMPHITSANIACGFHAGDPHTMRRSVQLAQRHSVAVGSHPSLPDLMGFGRRAMDVSPAELKDYLIYQTGALAAFCATEGTTLQHVKPHGIQYMMFEQDLALGKAAAEAILELDPKLIIFTTAGTKYDDVARTTGARIAAEGFADRPYENDKQLASRKLGDRALITDPEKAAEQAVRMVTEGKVRTLDGGTIEMDVQTICIHGDTPGAERIVAAVHQALEREGVQVKPLRDWLP